MSEKTPAISEAVIYGGHTETVLKTMENFQIQRKHIDAKIKF